MAKKKQRPPSSYTPEQIKEIQDFFKSNDFTATMSVDHKVELATGMRRGELCALQWDDLNLRTGELHIQRQVIHVAGSLHVSSPKTIVRIGS